MRFVFGLLACAAMNIALADDPPAPPASTPAATAPAQPSAAQPTPAAAATAAHRPGPRPSPAWEGSSFSAYRASYCAPAAPSAAQPAADAQAAAAAAQADAQEKHFVSEGYSVEMHHGNKMFCRREDQLGSRLGAKKYCSTGEQLAETERQAQRSMDPATWQKSNPSGK